LLNSVEHLIVSNELLHHGLIEVKKALEAKPKRNYKRLVGPGAFDLQDLHKMKEAADEKEKKKDGKKGKVRASKRATQIGNTPVVMKRLRMKMRWLRWRCLTVLRLGYEVLY
jgi:hypothetical protein